LHGSSRGDAIIDHDYCLSSDGDWLPSATVSKPTAFEFRTLPVDQCPQLGIIEPIDLDYLAIEHHFRWIVVDNCRDCQLRVTRRSDLSDNNQINWSFKHPGDFDSHGNATPRQREYDRLEQIELCQLVCQLQPCILSIPKHEINRTARVHATTSSSSSSPRRFLHAKYVGQAA